MNYTQVNSFEDTFNYLLDLVESGELRIVWEVKCNSEQFVCARKIDEAESEKLLLNKEVCCDICGHEFTVSVNDIFPAFEISSEYRRIVREEKKTPNRLKISKHIARL